MEIKRPFLFFLVFFSCYLIFSLTFVSAYQTGEVFGATDAKSRHVKFIMEPVLKIIDDLKPIACDASGYITFRAYVENVAEFDIVKSEAQIEDMSDPSNIKKYDVTSALSCMPTRRLISNQEITCRLNVNELLSRIRYCPFEKTENNISISFDISYAANMARVTDSKGLVITGAGVKPEMEIKFDVSQPVPEINCRTGSEIDVPVIIHDAETLFGEIAWSFSVNKTSSSMIECENILSRKDGGRDDIYLCALTIPDTLFQNCETGEEVQVFINAEAGDHKLSGNFSAPLSSSELRLSLELSPIEKLSCQIIDEDGTCVPKEPQQNVTARITGNVPEKLKVFESRYSLGDGNLTTLLCKKLMNTKYECSVFITLDKLGPSKKSETKSKDRDLTVFFDVKYLNYYKNISASTKVTLEGKVINDVLNTESVLKQKKAFLEWVINSKFQKALTIASRTLNLINMCCTGVSFAEQVGVKEGGKLVFEEGFKKAIKEAMINFLKQGLKQTLKKAILGTVENTIGQILNAIGNVGPKILDCIARESIKDINNEIQKLQNFENKTAIYSEDLKIPTIGETIKRHMAVCTAEAFWSTLKSLFLGITCAIGVIFVIIITGGHAFAPIKAVCSLATGALAVAGLAINVILTIISVLVMYNVILTATQAMALARERINVQLKVTNIMTDYTDAFSNTIESMSVSMSLNDMFQNLTDRLYGIDTVKLMFNSSRTGVLDSGDNICSGDSITINYDFEKLNLTKNFISKLSMSNSHSKTLVFDKLKGTYGPYDTDKLLGIEDTTKEPSEDMYIFTLKYLDKNLYYKLNYINRTCG